MSCSSTMCNVPVWYPLALAAFTCACVNMGDFCVKKTQKREKREKTKKTHFVTFDNTLFFHCKWYYRLAKLKNNSAWLTAPFVWPVWCGNLVDLYSIRGENFEFTVPNYQYRILVLYFI